MKHFQAIISEESKRQILEKEGKLPTAIVAATGGGSNAIGSFAHYIDEPNVRLIGVSQQKHQRCQKEFHLFCMALNLNIVR